MAHRHSLPAATSQLEDVAGELPTPVPSEWGIALAELNASRASAMLTVIMASQREQLAAERCVIERNELLESGVRDNFAWDWSIEHSDQDVGQMQSPASKSDTKSCPRRRYVILVTRKFDAGAVCAISRDIERGLLVPRPGIDVAANPRDRPALMVRK